MTRIPAVAVPARSREGRGVKLLSHVEHGERGEDRFAFDARRGRYALCDGASEGWDSGSFAGELAGSLVRHGATAAALAEARADFRNRSCGGLDWLAVRAQSRGSWTTALLVELLPGGRVLRASGIGDTTLFILDGFRAVATWPMENADAFGNTPDLVGDSEEGTSGFSAPPFALGLFTLGRLRRPSFALLTDALAARLLGASALEAAGLWRFFASASQDDFQSWAGEEMEASTTKRDDLSLLWVR